MKVSVLIPTRNRPELLREAVKSLLNQTLPPSETIVIDDGSDRPPLLHDLDPRIRIIHPKKAGKSKTPNRAHATATGYAVIVLEDDDLFPPRTLELHVKALAANPTAAFSYGRFLRFRGPPPEGTPSVSDPRTEYVPQSDP